MRDIGIVVAAVAERIVERTRSCLPHPILHEPFLALLFAEQVGIIGLVESIEQAGMHFICGREHAVSVLVNPSACEDRVYDLRKGLEELPLAEASSGGRAVLSEIHPREVLTFCLSSWELACILLAVLHFLCHCKQESEFLGELVSTLLIKESVQFACMRVHLKLS